MIQSDLAQLSTLLVYGAMAVYTVGLLAFATDLFGPRAGALDAQALDAAALDAQAFDTQALAAEGAGARRRRAAGIGMTTSYLGAVLHGIAIVTRGVAAGRVPWANMYEFTVVFTFVAVVAFLVLQRRWELRALGTFVVGPVLLGLGLAVAVLYVRADGLPPALDSYWLVLHVSVATLAIGIFGVSAAIAIVQLIQERAELRDDARMEAAERVLVSTVSTAGTVAVDSAAGAAADARRVTGESVTGEPDIGEPVAGEADGRRGRVRGDGLLARVFNLLPPSVELERLVFRLNGIGFVLWTFTVVAGAIWAEHAWGRPWGWDAKESWSFGIWVVYAAYLHARTTRGWQGRRSAYLTLVGFGLILGNYFVVNLLLNSRHAYSGIG